MVERKVGRPVPLNWPKGVPLPTIEEVRESTQNFEKTVRQRLDQLKGKLEGPDSKMHNTVVDI